MKSSKTPKNKTQVFSREAFPGFRWEDLNGKYGNIRVTEEDECKLVAFQDAGGGLYILEWTCKKP